MQRFSCAVGLIVCSWLSACYGSDSIADGGMVPDGALQPRRGLVIFEEPGWQATEVTRVFCAKAFECGLLAVTQEECARMNAAPCLGLVDFRAEDGLEECIASIRTRSCYDDLLAGCNAAATKAYARKTGQPIQTMEDGPCGDGVFCADDMICETFGSTCGTCASMPGIGDACEDRAPCWEGYCDLATSLCVEFKDDGDSCTRHEECFSFRCSSAGICEPETIQRTRCDSPTQCQSGRCIDGECVPREPLGGRCTSSSECDQGVCKDNVCKLFARCALGEEGEHCGLLGCRGHLQCVDGVCTELAVPMEDGAECHAGWQCASGHCIFRNTIGDTCHPTPAGAFCDANDQCASGACVSYRCTGTAMCEP